jgi:gamma-glutamyltranspeptidase / glutathione hydrolase
MSLILKTNHIQRTELGDPSFSSNISIYEEKMITSQTASLIRSKILDSTTQPISAYDPLGLESLVTHGTSHIVAADLSGLVISLTSTINLYFGSKLIVPSTGLIMNNEMDDFSTPGQSNNFGYIPSPSNYIRPGKRPQSSMAPTIVDFLSNSTFYYALGGVGGSYIITAVIEGLHYVLDRELGLYEALKEPRFHDQLVPNICAFEYEFDNGTVEFMRERGHNVTWESRESEACELEAVRRLPNGTFEAAGEPALVDAAGYAV